MARQTHIDFSALCLLHAFEQGLAVPGGWAEENACVACGWITASTACSASMVSSPNGACA